MSSFYLIRKIKSFLALLCILVLGISLLYYTNHIIYPLAVTYSKIVCESYVNEQVRSILKDSSISVSYEDERYNVEELQIQTIMAIEKLEEELGGSNASITARIPLGAFFKIHLFDTVGVKIPLRIQILQSIYSEITSNVKEYGLNNALVEIQMIIKVNYVMFLPFSSEELGVEIRYPLSMQIFEGNAVTLNMNVN